MDAETVFHNARWISSSDTKPGKPIGEPNPTLRARKVFELSELPEKGEEHLDVTLRQIIDLTPDNAEDNADPSLLSITRHNPTKVITDTTALYTYHRLVFDDVVVRVSPDFAPRVHLDYDEANACGFSKGDLGRILP